VFENEVSALDVVIEGDQIVASIQPKADGNRSIGNQVSSNSSKYFRCRAWREKRHDVTGKNCGIEGIRFSKRRQIQGGQVPLEPRRAGMVFLGCCDEIRIYVDTDYAMTTCE
jgi:hypothetical protein